MRAALGERDHGLRTAGHVDGGGSQRLGAHLVAGTEFDVVQVIGKATVAGALLDASMAVAANASLETGPRAHCLWQLADGRLAAGTKANGEQLFADAALALGRMGSPMEVTTNAS